jgi:hypothetical protein
VVDIVAYVLHSKYCGDQIKKGVIRRAYSTQGRVEMETSNLGVDREKLSMDCFIKENCYVVT